jgi:hypothetical protein
MCNECTYMVVCVMVYEPEHCPDDLLRTAVDGRLILMESRWGG